MEDQIKNETNYRITKTTAALMVGLALMVDTIELILEWLGIGLVSTWLFVPLMTLTFWVWFAIKGVGFLVSPKRFLTFGGMALIEIIPGLDASVILSFGWTVGTMTLIILTRLEDKGGIIGKATELAKVKKNFKKGKIPKKQNV